MQQFSIKNDEAVNLLNDLTKHTGRGKTEIVIEALKNYQKTLNQDKSFGETVRFVEETMHTMFDPASLGKAPSKEEIEEMLGMP